jgi:pyruvate dehydrogenase E1 component alpha subunit
MSEKELFQVMDPNGVVQDKSAMEALSDDTLKSMYRWMVFTRSWNTKVLSLQRQGRMGTLASVRGQEASNIGMGMAMAQEDWFCPSFREFGAQFIKGMKAKNLMLYWGGDERGARPPEKSGLLPVCITVGSHLLHAAGLAWAAKIKGDKIAVLSGSGDGSTSQGDFHEALNFAGVFKLPVVFAIQNNQWAISVPVSKQTASETLSEKACAYGIAQKRVDGNDVVAVYLALKELLDKAREEHEPALAELVTYRMDDHTTSDDASRYRTEEMVEPWRKKDPIDRMRKYLMENKGWDETKESELNNEITDEIENTVKEYESSEAPSVDDMFNHIYSTSDWRLEEQLEEARAHTGNAGR